MIDIRKIDTRGLEGNFKPGGQRRSRYGGRNNEREACG